MFEIVGYYVLRAIGVRRPTSKEVFGSYYDRPEGPVEFSVGFMTISLAIFAAAILF